MLGETIGNYRITAKLSEGGMGVVYRAEHALLGHPVAIKLLLPIWCEHGDVVRRFFAEAKVTSAIRHPGIVEVFDFGHLPDGRAYLVMELLRGEPLSARLARARALSQPAAAAIGRGIASALAAAHALGVVHRDLKPDNVCVVDPQQQARTVARDARRDRRHRAIHRRRRRTAMNRLALVTLVACNSFTPVAPDAPPADAGSTPSQLALDVASKTFDTVVAGQSSVAAAFAVRNTGDTPIVAIDVALAGDAAEFAIVDNGCTGELAAAATCTITLAFAPTTAGAKAAELVVDGGAAGIARAELLGTSLAPGDLAFTDPAPHQFVPTHVGVASPPATFTITNRGTATSGPIAIAIPNTAFEIVADACSNVPLAPNASCDLKLRFVPGAIGAVSTSITVTASPGGPTARSIGGAGAVTVTIARTGTGTGEITSIPALLSCGTICTGDFTTPTIALVASPAAGSTFDGWTGCTGATCELVLAGDTSVTAAFTRITHQVAVTRAGEGTIRSVPAGLTCPGTCSATFGSGDLVTLAATPDARWSFGGWSDACTGIASCELAVTGPRSVTARFDPQLTVTKLGTGAGTVGSTGAIDCGPACTANVPFGSAIELIPSPAAGSTFIGWGGACSGGGTCTVAATAPATVTAKFGTNRTLDVTVISPTGADRVAVGPPLEQSCDTACSYAVADGQTIVLTAVPEPTSEFARWTGGCSGFSPTCTIAVDANESATAVFCAPGDTCCFDPTSPGCVCTDPCGCAKPGSPAQPVCP